LYVEGQVLIFIVSEIYPMASTKKNQQDKDREKTLSHLRSMPEEIFHLDRELAFTRDEKRKRLHITHLDRGITVEVEVPFKEDFAVEKVKMDKDRKGFTMSGLQGEVWFELETCWKKAKPLGKPIQSPFPDIVIDQDRPFSIYQEFDKFTIECPLAQAGEIILKPGETGLFHFRNIHKFRCYPVSGNTIIENVTPVAHKDYLVLFEAIPDMSSSKGLTEEEVRMNEIAIQVFDGIYDGDDANLGTEIERLHVKWTMSGMYFECETDDISFSFPRQLPMWSHETGEYLNTILVDSDTFDRNDIRYVVDYFRKLEDDESMKIIHQELVDFMKNPDWNTFLKWAFDGTFTTVELRRILENIIRYSIDYLVELGLNQTRSTDIFNSKCD